MSIALLNTMKGYKPRKVEFNQIASVNDWRVKVYTITNRASFESKMVLENAIARLPEWLEKSTRLNLRPTMQHFSSFTKQAMVYGV
jgi:hypothetical protein